MNSTLVLNTDMNPLSILPLSTLTWQESIKLIYLNRVDVLHYYPDWYVKSPSTIIQVPSIILLRDFIKTSKSVKYSRDHVKLRDDYTCQYCNVKKTSRELTIDHVIPKSLGGKTSWTNVVASCEPCNSRKANHVNMRPLNLPVRPDYYDMVEKTKNRKLKVPDPIWFDFLGWNKIN